MTPRIRDGLLAAGCLIVCFLPGIFGGRFAPGVWYQALDKPLLTPPGWVFPIAWTALYVMMGISLFLVLRESRPKVPFATMTVFAVQLVLNGLWSWIFFGLQRPALAFVEILALWGAIALSLLLFRRLKPLAGLLLAPYLVWVTFAAYLNFGLWRLNP